MSLRVITSSEGGNFSSRTLCLSLQCKMLLLLLGLMWNSSHLNATLNTDYGLEATDQSLKIQRPVTNCEFGKLRRKRRQNCKYLISTLVMVRLEPGNSGGRMRGNYEMGNEGKLWLKFAVVIVFFNPLTLRSNLCFFTLSTIQFL